MTSTVLGTQSWVMRLSPNGDASDDPSHPWLPAGQDLSLELHVSLVASADSGHETTGMPNAFHISARPALGVQLSPPRQVILSAEEEQDFADRGFRSRHPIVITGKRRKQRTVVEVGGAEVELGSAELKVLLVLVAGHRVSASGWVRRQSLRSGAGLGFETLGDRFCPGGIDQALYRLRRAVAPALQGLSATDFIECSDGRVRLSTHRSYLRWDRPGLLRHFDPDVRAIAEKLPSSF